jgi:hypothetical protein
MAKIFSSSEKFIRELLPVGYSFNHDGKKYIIEISGKPRPQGKGECKTDIYILAKNIANEVNKEFKVSIKLKNADFLENKTSLERAIAIFGEDASSIISRSIVEVRDIFENENLVFFDRRGRTDAKCLTLGWKFELFNKSCGNKGGKMNLTSKQKMDVFAGTGLSESKKNSIVNDTVISNSGVANFILTVDDHEKLTGQDIFDSIESIEKFSQKDDIYFACKAINYRMDKDKWDGNRPLAVYVNWQLRDGKLHAPLVYNEPLQKGANEIGANLRTILPVLKIGSKNFIELRKVLHKSVRIFGA